MSTRPARMTSRLIIFAASAMSLRTLVNSPLASGCCRSCWRMNWERETERVGMASVLEPGDVFRPAAGAHRVAGGRERAVDERGEAIGDLARSVRPQRLEQEAELVLERLAHRRARLRGQSPQPLLERAERLLSRLVEELLVRVARLPVAD